MKYAVGIDEVGRGPLAGPVTVCAVQWLSDESPEDVLKGVRDSKKLSPAKRQEWADKVSELQDMLRVSVHSVDAAVIDEIGIMSLAQTRLRQFTVATCRNNMLSRMYTPTTGCRCLIATPATHIVKGDDKHPLIAFASIVAKVARDRVMVDLSERFGVYGFERNKGYGTREHRDAIRRHGTCAEHRRTFLRNII